MSPILLFSRMFRVHLERYRKFVANITLICPQCPRGTHIAKMLRNNHIPRSLDIGFSLCKVWYHGQPVECDIFGKGHVSKVCPVRGKCRRCLEPGHVARECKNPPKAWGTDNAGGAAAAVFVSASQDPTLAEAAGLSASKGPEPAGPGGNVVVEVSGHDDDDEDENLGSVAEGVSDDGCDDDGSDIDIDDVEDMETQASQSILPVGPTTYPGPPNVNSTVSHNVNESVNESLNIDSIDSSENIITNNVSGASVTSSDKSNNKSSLNCNYRKRNI